MGLVDLAGRIKVHVTRPCAGDVISRDELAFIPGLVEGMLHSAVSRERILGVGVGIPGVVDPVSGKVRLAPQLGAGSLEQEWVSLRRTLQEQLAWQARSVI